MRYTILLHKIVQVQSFRFSMSRIHTNLHVVVVLCHSLPVAISVEILMMMISYA